ncbi:MAG: hypothetical protein E5X09_18810, partial [Mesorhizobium sp.]
MLSNPFQPNLPRIGSMSLRAESRSIHHNNLFRHTSFTVAMDMPRRLGVSYRSPRRGALSMAGDPKASAQTIADNENDSGGEYLEAATVPED